MQDSKLRVLAVLLMYLAELGTHDYTKVDIAHLIFSFKYLQQKAQFRELCHSTNLHCIFIISWFLYYIILQIMTKKLLYWFTFLYPIFFLSKDLI